MLVATNLPRPTAFRVYGKLCQRLKNPKLIVAGSAIYDIWVPDHLVDDTTTEVLETVISNERERMATYENITADQMADFLESFGFQKMNLQDGTKELVWGKVFERASIKFSMRVYSGINPTGQSREKGKDAIRVSVFVKNTDGEPVMVGGSKRVHRVKGWRKNLQQRIDEWVDGKLDVAAVKAAQYVAQCPNCGGKMALRQPKPKQKWQPFYGCKDYPNCEGTLPLRRES